MLQELKKSEFYKVVKLLVGNRVNLEPEAVVKGYNTGWIYVDDINDPKSAVIWVKGMKGFYFVGDANNNDFNHNLNDFFDLIILPKAKEMEYKWIEMSGMSDDWDKTLAQYFRNRPKYAVSKQYVYKHKDIENFTTNIASLDKEHYIRKIDYSLLQGSISNFSFIESILTEWWDTIDNYLKHGIGYCVMHENKIICSCVTSFKKPNSMESHIHTIDDYRKQGFATIAVSRFLEYCRDNNLEPYWDCMETNYGSRALATKLGYEKQFEYTLIEFLV